MCAFGANYDVAHHIDNLRWLRLLDEIVRSDCAGRSLCARHVTQVTMIHKTYRRRQQSSGRLCAWDVLVQLLLLSSMLSQKELEVAGTEVGGGTICMCFR